MKADWSYPTHVRFGAGRLAELGDACAEAGIARPLLVSDPGVTGLPFYARAVAACPGGEGVARFSDVRGNPSIDNVDAGLAAYRAAGCDGVVALGGGSALDVGKAIAFMTGQTRPLWDFEDIGDHWKRANPDGIAPVVAIPTTAGTGSEVGRAAVIGEADTHRKRILFHPRMLPRVVISDPELCVGLPAFLTAATGMDALAHNLEAYCAPGYHPLADGIAAEGLRLIRTWLPRAYADGGDLEARGHLLAAASMGATAFQKGLGAVHSLSHPVGAAYDAHHGLSNGVFLPYVLAFNRPAIEERCGRLAAWLGLARADFTGLYDWIVELRAELAIPHTADALGLEAARIDALAEEAAVDPTAATNPRPAGPAEMAGLYRASLEGRAA